jgi:DNA-binding SARP family transcriptional activator/Tfp pilus assembly protein PilF
VVPPRPAERGGTDYSSHVQLRVLGPVCVHTDDGQTLTLPRRQERCLFGILLLEAGRTVALSRLVDLLWEDDPPLKAPQAVRTYVARIRGLLAQTPDVSLVNDRGGYRITADPDLIDVCRFRRLVQESTGQPAGVREVLLGDALALWRGPVLQHAASDQLRQRLCTDLTELHLQAQEEHLAARIDLGRHGEVLPQVAQLATDHPARERLVELHMLVLYRQGRTADALAVYQHARDRLTHDLGIDPGPALQHMQRAILRGEPVPSPDPVRTHAPAPVRPAQLPPDITHFTGRTEPMRQLDRLVATGSAAPAIATISGTAGVGKTALALHWAHQVADRFADGQLYVNLRGFDPAGRVVDPADAVRGFLDALEVPLQRIPADPDAQIALYRSLLHGKRMLVVLDNARDTAHVRPLLPGSPGCAVVVTSRNQLTGLIATGGAHPVALDLLTPDEAQQLLARRLGPDRVAAEPDATEEIVVRCARLPLALALVAAHGTTRPEAKLRVLADELRDTQQRWEALTGDDPASDVRTVFSWSYQALSPAAARLFRLLGLHPGPDITASAAASLAGVPLSEAELALAELTQANLLTEHGSGRYGMHDLLRAYAIHLADTLDAEQDRHDATARMLDHYLHSALSANVTLQPARELVPVSPPEPGVSPEQFTDQERAMAWFTAEHAVLLAAVNLTAATGFDTHGWQLAWTMCVFLDRQVHWQDWIDMMQAAVDATRRLGDRTQQARHHRNLALAYIRLRRLDEASVELERSLDLYRQIGDLVGEAYAHECLGMICSRQQRYRDALVHAKRSLDLCVAAGHILGQSSALDAVGWYHSHLGEYPQAIAASRQALSLQQEIGDRSGQAHTWDSLGYAYSGLGDHTEAIACYRRSLQLHREAGDRYNEGLTLSNLGDGHQAAGAVDKARDAWHAALVILDELDHPDATQVREKLARTGAVVSRPVVGD